MEADPTKLCITQAVLPFLNTPAQFDSEDIKSEIAMHTIMWREDVLISLNKMKASIIIQDPNAERILAVVTMILLVRPCDIASVSFIFFVHAHLFFII